MAYNSISIIIPTLNEEASIDLLIKKIDKSMQINRIKYEVVIVDDHSTDDSIKIAKHLANRYPITIHSKITRPGKAFSLIEGFAYAKYDAVAMIDADLQYPPEKIAPMLSKLTQNTDIVVANRKTNESSLKRKFASKTFNHIFAKVLHGMNCDVQSGLKVFKKEILKKIDLNPAPWAFDLEFLTKAKNAGYTITTIDIDFAKRIGGKSKVNMFKASTQIAAHAVTLKLTPAKVVQAKNEKEFYYKGQLYAPHTNLSFNQTAIFRLSKSQSIFLTGFALALLVSFALNWHSTLVALIAIISLVYFTDLLFNFFLIYRGFSKEPEIEVSQKEINEKNNWPAYTILCPLYKEGGVLPQFIKAISALDYPKDKLQVLLLLEKDDTDTISKFKFMNLPTYFKALIIPNSMPKTKPKALNYGLKYAKGEYVVVFDAEDIPEPSQLKKAVIAQEKAGENVACVQAKLNFYNPKQNTLTKLFTAEYSLWFDLVLTGLQSIHAPIPLGGTSNHFRTKYLQKIHAWDSFNVTEDCDLGMRIVKDNKRTAIMSATTFEEANSDFKNWFRQRTRWIKGYMQTYLVHMRDPKSFTGSIKNPHLLIFQLIVGGKVLSMFINPLMWIITLSYFTFRPVLGSVIDSFFPAPVLYIAITCLIFGNFLYAYYYMLGCAKRGHFDIVRYVFLIPFYWLAMSAAAIVATYDLIARPHYWEKTNHGLHLGVKNNIQVNLFTRLLSRNFINS